MKLLHSYLLYPINVLDSFYQPGAREARARLVLRLLSCFPFVCIYVCMYICTCVCVRTRPQISRALSYVIPLLCHERSGSY